MKCLATLVDVIAQRFSKIMDTAVYFCTKHLLPGTGFSLLETGIKVPSDTTIKSEAQGHKTFPANAKESVDYFHKTTQIRAQSENTNNRTNSI